jgi:Pvc16 N-terminal domain
MIADILVFLKNRLNAYFRSLSGAGLTDAGEDKVVFVDGDQKPDSITFRLGAVSLLLFNIERDVTLRQADNYVRVADDGTARKVNPDITVNLYLLLVAKFSDYEQSLRSISQILRYFQANPYFDLQNAPELGNATNHLSLELDTLTTTQQNELWGLLRCSYLPSLVYKVKAVTFTDDVQLPIADISEVILNQEQL